MIDLHCHILPGIDDGPTALSGSLAMARKQLEAGVHTVAATPHVAPEMRNTAAAIAEGVAQLQAALEAERVPLRVVSGGEVHLGLATELSDDELAALRLGGGPWLLVEAPLSPAATGVDALFRAVGDRGHRILVAHPERCPDFQRRPEALRGLVEDGMLVQVTAGAFAGRFGNTVRRFALELAAERLVHDVASDAHGPHGRAPSLRPELEGAGLRAWTVWLTEGVPAALLAGTELPVPPVEAPPAAPSQRRGLFGRLFRGPDAD